MRTCWMARYTLDLRSDAMQAGGVLYAGHCGTLPNRRLGIVDAVSDRDDALHVP